MSKSNITIKVFTPLVRRLRKEARDLKADTLVSMSEGLRNEIMADRLEELAKEIENLADSTLYY